MSKSRSIPEELIKIRAYAYWEQRQHKGTDVTDGSHQEDWIEAKKYLEKHWWEVWLWKLINRPVRRVTDWWETTPLELLLQDLEFLLQKSALLSIINLIANITIIISLITWLATEKQRRDAEVYQAWQVITAAHDQSGSGGRKEALEFLNSEPTRFPWIWLTWERQSLAGLAAPNAYLEEVDLQGSQLGKANLQEASLESSQLQEASLESAQLQKAVLRSAILQEASLYRANLQEADLEGVNFQGANLSRANLRKGF